MKIIKSINVSLSMRTMRISEVAELDLSHESAARSAAYQLSKTENMSFSVRKKWDKIVITRVK